MAAHADLSLDTIHSCERVMMLHAHRTNVVAQTAELQHNLEHRDRKLAYYADTFGVTTGEATQ